MTNLRRYRMRESAGTTYLEVENDAGTYLPLGSAITPLPTLRQDVIMTMGAGTYLTEPSTRTVVWDNVNLP